ncbi:MAG: hypothetical protein ACTHOO_01350 [Alcanivorax sp.]
MKKHYIIVWLFVLFAFAPNANANSYFSTRITPEEQAVFAFFRAAGDAPDYEYWIQNKYEYQSLPESKKEDFLVKEMMRLGHGYGMYDLNTDLLEIKLNILSKYIPKTEDEPAKIIFRILNLDENTTPTFNYRFGDGYISMVIERLDFFKVIELTEEKDKVIRDKIPYEGDEFDATLEIHVRAKTADYDAMIVKDDIKQWIMLSEIAYIKCEVDSRYTQQTYILWDYVSDWHSEVFRIQNMPEEEKYPHPYDLFKD